MKFLFALIFSALIVSGLRAQDFNSDEYLRAGAEDANQIFQSYLSPFMNGFGYAISNGWYNTAKTHKKLGFDLSVTMSMANIPRSELRYTFNNDDYTNLQLADPNISSAELPTIFGSSATSQNLFAELTDSDGNTIQAEFPAPPGLDPKSKIGFNVVPVPMLQLGVGLVKNTDLKLRYMPEFEREGYRISMYGVGVMHDMKQHFFGIRNLPIDISLLVAFTRLSTDFDIGADGSLDGSNQMVSTRLNSWTFQALASKKLAIITFYGGVGYNAVTSRYRMIGTYIINDAFGGTGATITLEDPIDMRFNPGGFRSTIGMRFNLGPVFLNGDYTLQEFNVLTLGFGVTIR